MEAMDLAVMVTSTFLSETMAKSGAGLKERLVQALSDGDYYAAQQLYKTLSFRTKNQPAVQLIVLREGAETMLKHGQVEAGAELGTLLTTRLSELKGQPDCPPPVPLLLPVFKAFPKDSPAHILRAWVKSAVSATATAANGQQGAPELHAAFAAHYATSQPPAYELAQRHLLRAQQPDQLVSLLRQWTGEAPLDERDLFIARAVFELLCLQDLKSAHSLLAALAPELASLDTPLVHFLGFLLETLQHDAPALFNLLRQRYAPSLGRDPSFARYLDMLAKVYFGLEPQQSGMAGLLSGFMRSFMTPEGSS